MSPVAPSDDVACTQADLRKSEVQIVSGQLTVKTVERPDAGGHHAAIAYGTAGGGTVKPQGLFAERTGGALQLRCEAMPLHAEAPHLGKSLTHCHVLRAASPRLN